MRKNAKWSEILDHFRSAHSSSGAMGGDEKLAKQKANNKLNARERISTLCDDGDFTEIGRLSGIGVDAFVCGFGRIDGRIVAVGAEDFTVAGGSIGTSESSKRYRIAEMALQERIPLIMLLDGAGHRPLRPDDPLVGRIPGDLQMQARLSGRIPFATAVLGPSAGHGALSAPLSDFSVMTPASAIFSGGPPLVKASLGEEVTKEELGGPEIALGSGLIDNLSLDDKDALAQIRTWLSFFPSSAWEHPQKSSSEDGPRATPELLDIIPADSSQPYDMNDVIKIITDKATWFEVKSSFGRSILTGLARVDGNPLAIIANQPMYLGGAIDVDAADKASHFIQVVDSFHIPLLFLTDVPGVLAGSASEKDGILRHAGRMFSIQNSATVPKIQLTLRKAFGFGSSVMGMNPFDNQTLNLAFPGVSFGAMPARGGDSAISAGEEEARSMEEAISSSGYRAAASLSIDDIIEPADARSKICFGLELARSRIKAGGNEPKQRIGNFR